jgi:hypothetical protein
VKNKEMASPKEYNRMVNDPEEMEIYELPDKEFKFL